VVTTCDTCGDQRDFTIEDCSRCERMKRLLDGLGSSAEGTILFDWIKDVAAKAAESAMADHYRHSHEQPYD
jgi:hypothetical protein